MTREIRFGQVSLCAESFGAQENPAILLIMGAASSMLWWEDAFCERLASVGFFVIRYDNRDTGRSTSYAPGKPEYTFEELADDAVRVLDAFGVERAVLMGMSMGGMLVQMLALRNPERIRGIVLLATMYFAEGAENLPYSSDAVNAFFADFGHEEPTDPEALIERTVAQWLVTGKSDRPCDEARLRALARRDVSRAANFASRVNHSFAQVTGDELARTAEIALPALVIHGTKDEVIPFPHGQMLARVIPGAELYTLAGAGHELHPQDFEAVAMKIVGKFL